MRKRQRKKIFKIVADRLRSGVKLYPRHYHFACNAYGNYTDRLYMTEFRPWWYEQEWRKYDLDKEICRHFEKWGREFERLTGINLSELRAYQEQLPKRKRARKPRKKRPAPIRKLRRPEEFEIMQKNRTRLKVVGEKVFSIQGYDFFIRYDSETEHWVVSDAKVGAAICWDDRYKRAVRRAREIIEPQFDKYLEFIGRMVSKGRE